MGERMENRRKREQRIEYVCSANGLSAQPILSLSHPACMCKGPITCVGCVWGTGVCKRGRGRVNARGKRAKKATAREGRSHNIELEREREKEPHMVGQQRKIQQMSRPVQNCQM